MNYIMQREGETLGGRREPKIPMTTVITGQRRGTCKLNTAHACKEDA